MKSLLLEVVIFVLLLQFLPDKRFDLQNGAIIPHENRYWHIFLLIFCESQHSVLELCELYVKIWGFLAGIGVFNEFQALKDYNNLNKVLGNQLLWIELGE